MSPNGTRVGSKLLRHIYIYVAETSMRMYYIYNNMHVAIQRAEGNGFQTDYRAITRGIQ